MKEFIPTALVNDIVTVTRLKGKVFFDRHEVQGMAVVFIKDDTVVHKHTVVHPGNYAQED